MEKTIDRAPVLRAYDDAIDRAQVNEICKNVYGGTDRIPLILPDLASSIRDFPLVLVDPASNAVLAFVNLLRLSSRAPDTSVFLLEAVRVAEHLRGRGLGTAITAAAQLHAQRLAEPTNAVRIVTTTVADNSAMLQIFNKLKFLPRGISHIWPAYDHIHHLRNAPGAKCCTAQNMLDELCIVLSPQPGTMHWTKVADKRIAHEVLRRALAGSGYDMVQLWYTALAVADVIDAFIDPHEPHRSMWVLHRKETPPAVVLVAIHGNHGHIHDHYASAVVSDVSAAEAVISFLAQFPKLGAFHVIFDLGLKATKIAQSKVLSQVQTSPFIVYESSP